VKEFLLWLFGGLGIPLAAWVTYQFRRWIPRILLRRRVKVATFTVAEGPYMDDFYQAFAEKISSARQNVYITGEGFDCSTALGRGFARKLIDAMRQALDNGARVVRLQTRTTIDSTWLDYLKGLLADYPTTFELYSPLVAGAPQVASLCVIDAEDVDRNTTEFMLEINRHFGSDRRDVAGTAVFVTGHQPLAETIRSRILNVTRDSEHTARIRTAEEAESFFHGEYYFAYGSNMCRAQMVTRCPSAIKTSTGVLPDMRLVFNRRGTYRPGSVASLEPAPGDRVYGVIWKMSSQEFEHLDETEDPTAYRREEATVYSLQGMPYTCHLYIAVPNAEDSPDPEYLAQMLKCAKDAGLPTGYLRALEALAVRTT